MVYWEVQRAPDHPSDTLAFQRTIEANDAWQQAKARLVIRAIDRCQ